MIFRMKEFSILHERSANKVGVDGVLVGAWTRISLPSGDLSPDSPYRVLDAGCGCGLISLMIAQRLNHTLNNCNFKILGIDVDSTAVEEAKLNVSNSPWPDNIDIYLQNFSTLNEASQFNLIVSNPPFFHSGLDADTDRSIIISEARLLARHAGELSPESLVACAPALLKPGGSLALIVNAGDELPLIAMANDGKLKLQRLCRVIGREGKPPKRVLLQFVKPSDNDSLSFTNPVVESLTIEHSPNIFTEDYISLCKPFYIKF